MNQNRISCVTKGAIKENGSIDLCDIASSKNSHVLCIEEWPETAREKIKKWKKSISHFYMENETAKGREMQREWKKKEELNAQKCRNVWEKRLAKATEKHRNKQNICTWANISMKRLQNCWTIKYLKGRISQKKFEDFIEDLSNDLTRTYKR